MKFTDRLFPFLNKEIFNENILTAYWVIALIAIFLIALIYLIIKLIAIRESFKKTNLKTHKKIGRIWTAYQSSFSIYGDVSRTTEFSEEYFNEQNILLATLNLRAINSVPNTLIGLGILGTFVGLTYGIADSNFETTEAIKNSIDNLLSGMGTAFVSSIWGMGLSLVFTNIFKLWQSNITRQIQDLCLDLDKENKIEQQEYETYQQEKQRNIINELFNEYLVADTDDGGKQLPKNVFRQLLEESEKQTQSLQNFSDDLPANLELMVEKLVADNNQQISQLIEEKLVPVLEDLKAIKQDSGTQVIENAVQRLADSMKAMMDDFKNTVTGDTKQEMENLVERLTVVSESLVGIPNIMTDITLQVSEVIEALKETVVKNIEQSKIEATETNKRNQETFTAATIEYKSTVEDIQDHMELLLSTQKDNIKQVSQINDEIKATLQENSQVNQQFESMIQKSKIVVQLIESVSNKFENNSTTISQTSTNLKASISDFGKSINEYVDRNNSLLNYQQETLQKTKNVSELYAARFETIENGLSGIFDQIQTGLKDYQKTTGENLNQYLKQFSSILTAAQQGLENNVSGLNDITEELTEQIEKLTRRR
jgi:DNA repair exonuclease SbcCD ATPase subunit